MSPLCVTQEYRKLCGVSTLTISFYANRSNLHNPYIISNPGAISGPTAPIIIRARAPAAPAAPATS